MRALPDGDYRVVTTQRLKRILATTTAWVRIDGGALGSALITVVSATKIVGPTAERRTSRLAGYISNRLALGVRKVDMLPCRSMDVLGARVASLAVFRDPAAHNLIRATGKAKR